MTIPLTTFVSLQRTQHHIHVALSTPHQVMSSAVLNGGLVLADHLVNLKVPHCQTDSLSPQETLSTYCEQAGWEGNTVGMMTAASMASFRMAKASEQGVEIVVLVTTGLSNPRRAGDRAEHRLITADSEKIGTINIVILTTARLTEAAMVEALLIMTEAKAAALQDAGILSPVSHKIATGTGTDSAAIVNGHGPISVKYCGKHVLFGEILGRMVTETVAASIAWEQTYPSL